MKRILIVEDDPAVQRALRHCARAEGHRADGFDSVEDAESALLKESYDLLITDFSLRTDRTGLDLLRFIRDRNLAIAVILISGSGENGLERRALELGAVAFIKKPFPVTTFTAACRAALAGRPAQMPQSGAGAGQ